MKKVVALFEDYWHHREDVEPMLRMAFPENEFALLLTENPEEARENLKDADLFVNYKDAVENDQIPTPVWCDDAFVDELVRCIKNGMGYLCCHAAMAGYTIEHRHVQEVAQGMFVHHPPQCPVAFEKGEEHFLLHGVENFQFPEPDEHYFMELIPQHDAKILAYMTSEHGKSPAVWIRELGKGKVCMLTPAHRCANLIYPEYMRVFNNMAAWCLE